MGKKFWDILAALVAFAEVVKLALFIYIYNYN